MPHDTRPHHWIDSAAPQLALQGVQEIVPAADMHARLLCRGLRVTPSCIAKIKRRVPAAVMEHPFVSFAECPHSADWFRLLRRVEWQQLLDLQFFDASFVNDSANMEDVVAVQVLRLDSSRLPRRAFQSLPRKARASHTVHKGDRELLALARF